MSRRRSLLADCAASWQSVIRFSTLTERIALPDLKSSILIHVEGSKASFRIVYGCSDGQVVIDERGIGCEVNTCLLIKACGPREAKKGRQSGHAGKRPTR